MFSKKFYNNVNDSCNITILNKFKYGVQTYTIRVFIIMLQYSCKH
jgi:hypothetical protein